MFMQLEQHLTDNDVHQVHYSHVYTRLKEVWTRGGEDVEFVGVEWDVVCTNRRRADDPDSWEVTNFKFPRYKFSSLTDEQRGRFMDEVYEKYANADYLIREQKHYMSKDRSVIRLGEIQSGKMNFDVEHSETY